MSRLDEIGDADSWRCWLCAAPVDPVDRSGGPWSGTVDHVVPRSRQGATTPANLRLAHARCNRRRSSGDPVIDWPADLPVVDAAPLFPAALRVVSSGDREVIGVTDPISAPRAAAWLEDRLGVTFRGSWRVDEVDMGPMVGLRLSCVEAPDVIPWTRRR